MNVQERIIHINISSIDATVLVEVPNEYELIDFYSKIERKINKNGVYTYKGFKKIILLDKENRKHIISLETEDGFSNWKQNSKWIIDNNGHKKEYFNYEYDRIVNDIVRILVNKVWKYIENAHIDLKRKKFKFYVKLF